MSLSVSLMFVFTIIKLLTETINKLAMVDNFPSPLGRIL
jgi:hypothetical protein